MRTQVEWPTIGLLAITYVFWCVSTTAVASWSVFLSVVITGVLIAQHSSLQHEALHGHPFKSTRLNTLLVCPGLSLVIPYLRFRDTHLAHHNNCELTDPFDDPESNFLDVSIWGNLSPVSKRILQFNNALAGRILVGALIGTSQFLISEARNWKDPLVRRGWFWHVIAVVPVLIWVWLSPMPLWAYFVSCYIGLSLLRVRTFLEHRVHHKSRARSVVVDDRGPLSILFLNNNYHAVHHMHPRVAWYDLPKLFHNNRERYLDRNDGYFFDGYHQIFRQFFLKSKDPVLHPGFGKNSAKR